MNTGKTINFILVDAHPIVRDGIDALILPDDSAIQKTEYLFDPGYLIFDPLPIPLPPPFGTGSAFFPTSGANFRPSGS